MINFSEKIDFKSRISYYVQLKEILQNKIEQKQLNIGDKLPSEAELCDVFKISRTVVRQALMELEHEGLIFRRKGKGAFVAEPKIKVALTQLKTGFIQDMSNRGIKTITKVLKQEVVPANKKVAKYLNLKIGTPVLEIQRLRFVDNEPIVLVSSFLPLSLCSDLEHADLTKSLYNTLQNICHITFAYGERIIEAVCANERESKLLDVDLGAPMILMISLSYLENETPVEYSSAIHRGDRSRIEAEVFHYREVGNVLEFSHDTKEKSILIHK